MLLRLWTYTMTGHFHTWFQQKVFPFKSFSRDYTAQLMNEILFISIISIVCRLFTGKRRRKKKLSHLWWKANFRWKTYPPNRMWLNIFIYIALEMNKYWRLWPILLPLNKFANTKLGWPQWKLMISLQWKLLPLAFLLFDQFYEPLPLIRSHRSETLIEMRIGESSTA